MTQQTPSLSVIVPTHGRPAFLDATLSSIACQKKLPNEVVVVDDIGDEATMEVVESKAKNYPVPLRYLHNTSNPGACGSRNLGAANSTGDFIAFHDDDDQWDPQFLTRCVDALTGNEIDFALTYVDRCFPDGSVKRLTTANGLTADNVLHQRVAMTGSSFVIRRPAFENVGGFDSAVPVFNDWDFFIRLVRSGRTYAVVPEALVKWIEHSGARITTDSLRRADGIDRFLGVYGADMSYDVRAYFLRIAFGIRKSYQRSQLGRWFLTATMLRRAGVRGASFILWQSIGGKLKGR